MAEGASHIVQAIVTVDGADHRQTGGFAQQGADHIGPGTMAVNQLKAALADVVHQTAADAEDVVSRHDFRGDPQLPGLLSKGTVPETDQLGGNGLIETLQQAQDVGFGAAGVAAADQMNDLHEKSLSFVHLRNGTCGI